MSMKISNLNTRLVSSTDPTLRQKCPKCREVISECACVPDYEYKIHNILAILRVEKQGRSGKIVTVIDRLPKNQTFLKDLTTKIKKKCGCGGTYLINSKDGVIEIQGDKRAIIRDFLEKEGIKSKG